MFDRKKATKPNTSLEERIRQLTCDVDEPLNENATSKNDGKKQLERRSSPTGEENPQSVTKYVPDKSFSPVSTASSSSNSSISAYKRLTDIFHKEKRQERIPEADENPIVILPQVHIYTFFFHSLFPTIFEYFHLIHRFVFVFVVAIATGLSMSIGSRPWNGLTFTKCK